MNIYMINMDLFSLLVCVLILVNVRFKNENLFFKHRFIILMLAINIIMLVISAVFKLIDGKSGSCVYIFSSTLMFLYYAIVPVAICAESFYVYFSTVEGRSIFGRLFWAVSFPAIVLIAFDFINLFTHRMYVIGLNNTYQRGKDFAVFAGLCAIYQTVPAAVLYFNRKNLEFRRIAILAIFCLLPYAGGVLEILDFDSYNVWNFLTFSLLLMYLHVENINMRTDYLTGIYNRFYLDRYLKKRIKNCNDKLFCGVLIDIDNFKGINDNYGHQAGDEALGITARVLKSCVGKNDFLARYGGDEFMILKRISDRQDMLNLVNRIEGQFENFNAKSKEDYLLAVSMGFDIYNCGSGMTCRQFIAHIDGLMYEKKKFHKPDKMAAAD